MIVTITIETADELERILPFLAPKSGQPCIAEYHDARNVAENDISVEDMNLTVRTINALQYAGNIWTANQMMAEGRRRLLRIPNIGYRSISEIESALKERGFVLPA